MAGVPDLTKLDSTFDVDKLTFEIFSILEKKFLFGPSPNPPPSLISQKGKSNNNVNDAVFSNGKVRILSIDGSGSTDGVLSAASLSRLEMFLRRKSGYPKASISDFFDVAAGSGSGGILAALIFTRGKDGRPMFSAGEALTFMVQNGKKLFGLEHGSPGLLRRILRSSGKSEVNNKKKKILDKVFGEFTLKDTIKSVLIPCYDLSTHAPFLFSRADALEMDGYDFKMRDVCLATSADLTVEMDSVDSKTRIVAVNGGIAISNPTASAITHVLNNKMEFPMCKGLEDLIVVSLGNGEADLGLQNTTPLVGSKTPARFVRIAEEGASDMVDQAVSMAFGQCRSSNYVRIQANGVIAKKNGVGEKQTKCKNNSDILAITEEILAQKNVESVLFQGKKVVGSTNLEKLEAIAGELVKQQERRKTSILPTVVLKLGSNFSPRTSSATTLSTASSC